MEMKKKFRRRRKRKRKKKKIFAFIKKNKPPPKKKKKKEKKESEMKINTELVREKVPENKSCPPSFLAFCKVNYLPRGQMFRIYIYICMYKYKK